MSDPQVHYLDFAATSPLLPEAEDAWRRAQADLREYPGNPAALHAGGRKAKRLLEDAREQVAANLGAERPEVVFTSGATESDALAVHAGARWVRDRHPECTRVWLSQADHDAVAQQAGVLESDGFDVSHFRLGADGVSVLAPWGADTALVSMALVCSELGTIQPVGDLVAQRKHAAQDHLVGQGHQAAQLNSAAQSAHDVQSAHTEHQAGPVGQSIFGAGLPLPLIHTDAAQAVTCEDLNFHGLGVDFLTIGGHKIGAPVGVGVLVSRRGITVSGDRPGGGQEQGIRSGTVDVAGACALAAALNVTVARRNTVRTHLTHLREYLLAHLPRGVTATIPAGVATTPSIVHLSLDTHHPEAVLMALDLAHVWASAGSACHAGVSRPSAIVMAMGRSENQALGVLRISMGATTDESDIDALLAALPQALQAGQALDHRE